jgi:uroporphyrin-III C-methyltransferase / precorrin-2 dehydrogenase / sirohydrochlorin ferrochelatase
VTKPKPGETSTHAFPRGSVCLVGGGPGDPELLTRRAAQRLADADVVFYDALVDQEALALAPTARRVFVGKRAGRQAVSQDAIHRLMIRAAQRGLRVVRLKGGDPFVFGRGGEEALALSAAGIPFEVVPGITSATSAAALAGIPVTHRGLASAFVVVSGHGEEGYRPMLESMAPHAATIVVLMGVGHIGTIAALLIDRGWRPHTPAAVLFGASTAQSLVWTTSLSALMDDDNVPDHPGPGTVVIGEVVRLQGAIGSIAPGEAAAALR